MIYSIAVRKLTTIEEAGDSQNRPSSN